MNSDLEKKALVWAGLLLVATAVVITLVFTTLATLVYKVKLRHRERHSPLYLGSCRRINSTGNVNIGMEALERAPPLHPHHLHPDSQRQQHREQEGEADTSFSLLASQQCYILHVGGSEYHRRSHTDSGERVEHGARVSEGTLEDGECDLQWTTSSLSRTYTYPNLVLRCEPGRNDSAVAHVYRERLSTVGSSELCLATGSYLVVQKEWEEGFPQCKSERRLQSVIYMGLNPRTMDRQDDVNHYQTICKVQQQQQQQDEGEVGLQDKKPAKPTRPPPRLVPQTKKTLCSAVVELQLPHVMRGGQESSAKLSCREEHQRVDELTKYFST